MSPRPSILALLAVLPAVAACHGARPPAPLPHAVTEGQPIGQAPLPAAVVREAGAGGPGAASGTQRAGSAARVDPPATVERPADVVPSLVASLDRSVEPCGDFYRFACGGWESATKLPADRSRWGRGFSIIHERNLDVLRTILEEAARAGAGPDEAKLGRFWSACMDEAAIEQLGARPLVRFLQETDAVDGPASLMAAAGWLHRAQVPVLFTVYVDPDYTDPKLEIAHLTQGGLGLPDRDYYLKTDGDSVKLRDDYRAHVARMLELAGATPADAGRQAEAILAFETALARASRPRAELRDPEKTYHKLDLEGLEKLAPGLDWKAFFASAGNPRVRDINVAVPEFFQGLETEAKAAAPETLRAYLRWHAARRLSPYLSNAFVDESFAFYGRRLSGQKELEPRWKRCVGQADDYLGELLAQEYVERRFAGQSKQTALAMIGAIEESFHEGLGGLAWMDDRTRERALEKSQALKNKIGYPDAWRDYSRLDLAPDDYFGNAIAARRFDSDYQLDKVGGEVDPGEWEMTPPTVNAYYNPLANEMVFPAGILQPPFFEQDMPAALNFGGIGMVMGHELTHGFDDEGRKFDPAGVLRPWWDDAAVAKFEAAAKCVEEQYSGYEVLPGVHLNGKLTLGENIADIGGIKQAYLAWKRWRAEHGANEPEVAGLTPEQMFFVGFAQTWCTIETPEIQRMLATVDPHSAAKFRVNGPLSNLPEFWQAFGCGEGSAMRRASPCQVW